MIVSHKHKLVMLLPWKTASQTLRARLKHVDQSPYSEFFEFNPCLNRIVNQHLTLADFLALPESRMDYRLAVFVRNPYDRVFSGFRQLFYDLNNQPLRQFPAPWIRDLVTRQLGDNFAMLCKAQFDINSWFMQLPAYYLLACGRDTSLQLHPAHYWTHWNGRKIADFVGRVEHFETDFDRLCREFGIESLVRENANHTEGKNIVPDERGYRYANRLRPGTIARINELFGADFDLFGYEIIHPE
jgi:hypothetical protein